MRLLTATSLAVIALVATGAVANGGSVEARFALFKEKYGRKYVSPEEERKRLAIYAANLRRAGELQLRNPKATFGENEFSDLSPEEFKTRHNAEKAVKAMKDKGTKAPLMTSEQLSATPKQVDWRKHGAVTPVKNQGQCGSCWAFSTTGNIEGQWFLAGNNLTSLSEQELVACDGTSDGCNGGFTGGAMDWLVQTQGGWITSEADYPYVSGGGYSPGCQLPKPHVAQIYGHHTVASDENQMAAYLAVNGPLSICVDASTWQSYSGGIMTDCPSWSVDHCVLAVGYNLDASTPYWIVKNSWAPSWGIDGYVYIEFGQNECAITSTPNNALVHHTGPTPPPTPAPPTPPPTPAPPVTPAPPLAEATQKLCPDSSCHDGCSVHHFQQGVCLVNPDGVGVMVSCRENSWTLYLWYSSQTCSGEYYVQRQALDTCIPDDDGTFIYNECPTSAVDFPVNNAPPRPAAFGTTASLPAHLQKKVERLANEHKAKAHRH